MKTIYVYDNYEIHGCRRCNELEKDDRQYVEPCADAQAQFWTLYGRIAGQGVEAIGDFDSREAAEQVYRRITGHRFTGSYEPNDRLRLMHASAALLAACRMVTDRWDHGDLAEAARTCHDAITEATSACPPWEADESYSVLLLHPDYANDSGTEAYYAFVKAPSPAEAVVQAQRQAVAAQEGVEIGPGASAPLLVTQGHHVSEPLFYK